jgi:protein-S-isoprenylcysteine O-methyltransferase Ste14
MAWSSTGVARRSGETADRSLRRRLPREVVVLVWSAGVLAAHALLPVALARRSGRTGAQPRRAARLAGSGCLVAGTAGVAWSLAQHFEAAPERRLKVATLEPQYLLRAGPYRYSRNPMYVSEVVIWAGWTLLFADPLLAALTGAFALALNRIARLEEATLAARFGVEWREYAARTPRWIGIAGRSK